MTIQRAILFGARDLRFVEETLPETGENRIYVETEVTALSTGTDLGNYEGRSTEVPGAPGYPRPVGYSNVGVIRRCGAGVSGWRPGERVFTTRPHQSAYLAAPDDLMIRVPEGVESEAASLAYLTQLGVAALRQVGYESGDRVCVIGLGVIGLCAVAVANAMGARVAAVGNSEFRLDLAAQVGAAETNLAGGSRKDEADVVVLTANPWGAYREALEAARYGGRIAVLGFPGRAQDPPDFNPLDAAWLYRKQLTICGSGFSPRAGAPRHEIRFNLARNLELIFEYMRVGKLPLKKIVTHRFHWSEMRCAYELALSHSKDLAAAVFDWADERVASS